MSTETLSFGLLGPEKYAFKDGNPTYKIMIKKNNFKVKVSFLLKAVTQSILGQDQHPGPFS